MAVVDLRLMFQYEPRRDLARSTEAELVAAHMRIAYSVPQSREIVYSGYSSEPLLAEAAARQMRVFRFHDPNATLDILQSNMKSGLISKGERGELVAREILTSAYDRAIEREFEEFYGSSYKDWSESKMSHFPLYNRGVRLITFIEELFASPFAEAVLDSFPGNITNGIQFRKAFKDARVRFTHFGKMADDYGVTAIAARVALIRGMAIIACTGERAVDCIIPVVLENSKLQLGIITGILIQIKRRRVKGTVYKNEVLAEEIDFFSSGQPSQLPYVSLVMELGVQNAPSAERVTHAKVKGKAKLESSETASTPKKRNASSTSLSPSNLRVLTAGKHHHTTPKHPRYSIFAYGCSNTVYKGITEQQRPTYSYLLGSKSLLEEHTRGGQGLAAVRRLKPFWAVGEDCYHWVDEQRLRKPGKESTDDDTVDVFESATDVLEFGSNQVNENVTGSSTMPKRSGRHKATTPTPNQTEARSRSVELTGLFFPST